MGLKSLKWEFERLTDLPGTAANARAFLVSIQLSPYGYDFRTIASWSECVYNICTRLEDIEEDKRREEEYRAYQEEKAQAEAEAEEKTELEEQIVKKYNTLSLTWFIIKKFHKIRFKRDIKALRRFISLWIHPDINKDKKANKYMAIFNDIMDVLNKEVPA